MIYSYGANEYNNNNIITPISNDLKIPFSMSHFLGWIESIFMNVVHIKGTTDATSGNPKFHWQVAKILQLSKKKERLMLLDLKCYFWAAQIIVLLVWIQNDTHTRLLNIENSLCQEPSEKPAFICIYLYFWLKYKREYLKKIY